MKTIILMPVYQSATFFDVVTSSLYELNPQPELYVFAEHNSTDGTLEMIQQFKRPKKVIRLRFTEHAVQSGKLPSQHLQTAYDVVGVVRQVLLQVARKLDPDFAIFIDSDIRIRSHDLISRLTRWQNYADIVGGPIRRLSLCGVYFDVIYPDWSATPWRQPPDVILSDAMVVGAGCMCLPREVIQDHRLYFYPVIHEVLPTDYPSIKGEQSFVPSRCYYAEDVAFCMYAGKLGYRIAADWSILLDHWADNRIKPWTLTRPNAPPAIGPGMWLPGD